MVREARERREQIIRDIANYSITAPEIGLRILARDLKNAEALLVCLTKSPIK